MSNGHGNVRIIRSIFDTKMAHMFSGAVGANYQLCTATFKQIRDLIEAGFLMNREEKRMRREKHVNLS